VTNIPGAVPVTSTFGLTNATLPYTLEIAQRGFTRSLRAHPALASGVNIAKGKVTYRATAQALGLSYTALNRLL
jgi:alanine dehydrogenase